MFIFFENRNDLLLTPIAEPYLMMYTFILVALFSACKISLIQY